MKNSKRIIFGLLCVMVVSVIFGCGQKKQKEIQISLWTDERNEKMLQKELAAFQKKYKDQVKFKFSISMEGEDTCKGTVLSNPKGAADIYTFADDQLDELVNAKALLEITENVDEVLEAVGGKDSGAAKAVLRDGRMYAYPETAGNGYFMYYNSDYFEEEDITSLDRVLEVCRENNKKFTMDLSSGWYLYSFFKAAGLELTCNEEKNTNICNWNATDTEYTGVDVAKAILRIVSDDAFVSMGDDAFVEAVRSGEVIAGVNGAWNAEKISKAWKEGYAAAKLPTYTLCGEQKQMCSFMGYKMVGVNAYTKHPDWCMKLAEFLTNKENQLNRFETTGECPSNEEAAKTKKIQASPAVAALGEQAPYGDIQSVAEPFWSAASKLGVSLSAGNLDQRDLQELLDETQKEIVTPSKSEE